MDERKKFRLADVILSVICVVFVAEAAAPVASIGNSQYFWWLFMMVAFLLPYGMISSELGTAYPGDGGLYDWIHKAFPETKWAARASWYYWINFPLWMASLAVVCPELLSVLTGLRFSWAAKLLIELAFIWVVTWIACYPVCDSILILNISAAIKMLLALTVGVLGIVYVVKNGFVNDMAFRTFLPGFDLHSLSYISVIIFNFLGFEVVCTYADNMRDPKRQTPVAQQRLAVRAVEDLALAVDPHGAEPLGVRGQHEVFEHAAAVGHVVCAPAVAEHDHDHRRTVVGVDSLADHGGVELREPVAVSLRLHGDDRRRLLAHGGRGIRSGLEHTREHVRRHGVRPVGADAAPGADQGQKIVFHEMTSLLQIFKNVWNKHNTFFAVVL